MSEQSNYELPKASEKLGYKFILDAIRDHQNIIEEPVQDSIVEPSEEVIPLKKYFRMGEVSKLLKVEPHVIRYWESEFSSIRPIKSNAGQRVYRRKDVELLSTIKQLLHVEKFSIKGARKRLSEQRTPLMLKQKTATFTQQASLQLHEVELAARQLLNLARNYSP